MSKFVGDDTDGYWISPKATSMEKHAAESSYHAKVRARLAEVRKFVEEELAKKFKDSKTYKVVDVGTDYCTFVHQGKLWQQEIPRTEAGDLDFGEFPFEIDPITHNPV